jgi:hypothetical protein
MFMPFIGSEAIANGALTRGQLRWNHTAVHPDVYLVNGQRRDIVTNAYAAWLWTGRRGVIAGRAAAALYGDPSVMDENPIELIVGLRRQRREGVVVRNERIGADEIRTIASMPVTSPTRTALDLARHLSRDEAVMVLDQLAAVTGVEYRQVVPLIERYRGARGVEGAWEALSLMDGGTRTPKETQIRLWLIDGGLPTPRTSIVLGEGPTAAIIGMGWEDAKVGVSHYEPDDAFIVQRLSRQDLLQRMGWVEIQVVDQHLRTTIVGRARDALRMRRRTYARD